MELSSLGVYSGNKEKKMDLFPSIIYKIWDYFNIAKVSAPSPPLGNLISAFPISAAAYTCPMKFVCSSRVWIFFLCSIFLLHSENMHVDWSLKKNKKNPLVRAESFVSLHPVIWLANGSMCRTTTSRSVRWSSSPMTLRKRKVSKMVEARGVHFEHLPTMLAYLPGKGWVWPRRE